MKKRILLYGLGQWTERRIRVIKEYYDVIAYSDMNEEKRNVDFIEQDRYIRPCDIQMNNYDFLFIGTSERNYQNAMQFIQSLLDINNKKVVIGYEWWSNILKGYKESFGALYPNKYFYVIRRINNQVGLFSNFLVFMQHIRKALVEGYIPIVDMQNYDNAYLDEDKIGLENSWEYYFEQPYKEYLLSDVYNSRNVYICSENNVPDADYNYEKILDNRYVRDVYNHIFSKYMKIKPDILNEVTNQYELLMKKYHDNGSKICAVLLRGTEYTKLKPYNHPVQPTIEQAISKIKELKDKWGYEYIYCSSEDRNILKSLKEEFPQMYIEYECPRYELEGISGKEVLAPYRFNGRRDERYLKGKEYLISMALMTFCDFFIAGNVSGTIGVLTMKGQFDEEYIFNLGKYGFEEEAIMYKPQD